MLKTERINLRVKRELMVLFVLTLSVGSDLEGTLNSSVTPVSIAYFTLLCAIPIASDVHS